MEENFEAQSSRLAAVAPERAHCIESSTARLLKLTPLEDVRFRV